MTKKYKWDVFISHATEDKESFVRPLALALRSYGLKVWYDEFTLDIGDKLRESIEAGLRDSRYGIVVVTPFFAGKHWTENELSALYSLQEASRENSILPIWHNIERQQVVESLPFLANIIALNTSSNTFQEIVEKIIVKTQSENIVDIKKHIPTGISMLDTILSGGLPRPSSTSLIGVKGIGKSTLATQIQISALFRGEPCIYITYREPPFDIIERFFRLDAPVEEFISKGLLRILDNFSEINGISQKEVEQCISNKTISDAIVRINNPRDSENYYKKQLAIMDDMGTGGINIIDSVNERYDLIDTEDKSLHFKRFRARVKLLQHSAIHIVTETKEHDPYNDMIKDIQGGTIKMYTVEESGVIHRKIQVDSMRDGHYVPFERTFSITDKGIEIY